MPLSFALLFVHLHAFPAKHIPPAEHVVTASTYQQLSAPTDDSLSAPRV
jgi:hypothetical protein